MRNEPRLPNAYLPVLVKGVERLLKHYGPDKCPGFEPTGDHRTWYPILPFALLYTKDVEGNPLRSDERLRGLIERTGRAMLASFNDPELIDPATWWYEGRRVHEWHIEHWLAAFVLLREAGHESMIADWTEPLEVAGRTFNRFCAQIEHLKRLTSANLKISTNHFSYFAADLIRLGQVFDVPAHVERGLDVAMKILDHQHPDGYWPETHGPTVAYNLVTAGAVGLYHQYTGKEVFRESLRRAVDFQQRYMYPDGRNVATLDQRVRWRQAPQYFPSFALSRWPAGRGLAELTFAEQETRLLSEPRPDELGRIATDYLYYETGPIETPLCCHGSTHYRLSDLPGGVVQRDGWFTALCGIPSRHREHHYTLDRQNLLSVYHNDTGIILGGGNSRDTPEIATFYAKILRDPQSLVDKQTHDVVYLPVAADLAIHERGASLDLEYWGFDARLEIEIVDRQCCRVRAFAGTLPINDPILFNPNIMVDAEQPLRTGTGAELALGNGSELDLTAGDVGGAIGQGRWRIEIPEHAKLRYPVQPFSYTKMFMASPLLVVSVPITNREALLTVRVG